MMVLKDNIDSTSTGYTSVPLDGGLSLAKDGFTVGSVHMHLLFGEQRIWSAFGQSNGASCLALIIDLDGEALFPKFEQFSELDKFLSDRVTFQFCFVF